jgi:hypothetical protein
LHSACATVARQSRRGNARRYMGCLLIEARFG